MTAMATVAGAATFEAIGTTNTILTTDPGALEAAVGIAQRHLRDLDRAVSRFRPDSEVSLLAARARRAPAETFVSPTFAAYLGAALRVARLTGGLVDPTVGGAVVASGYDDDLAVVRSRPDFHETRVAGVPRWHTVHLNLSARRVGVAPGTLLDLGATAKAHAADTIAHLLADELSGGFVVNLGGDVAVSGTLPPEGWSIGIDDADGITRQVVKSTGQAIATSSTQRRVWTADGVQRHHIIDPRTGHTAAAVWAQVSCAAATCLEANAASTAAVVLGAEAPTWLTLQGIPARLDAVDGRVVTTSGWPSELGRAA